MDNAAELRPGPVPWDYGDWHHAVVGVELGTDRRPLTVIWTDTFYSYGVEVLDEPIEHRLALGDEGPSGSVPTVPVPAPGH